MYSPRGFGKKLQKANTATIAAGLTHLRDQRRELRSDRRHLQQRGNDDGGPEGPHDDRPRQWDSTDCGRRKLHFGHIVQCFVGRGDLRSDRRNLYAHIEWHGRSALRPR